MARRLHSHVDLMDDEAALLLAERRNQEASDALEAARKLKAPPPGCPRLNTFLLLVMTLATVTTTAMLVVVAIPLYENRSAISTTAVQAQYVTSRVHANVDEIVQAVVGSSALVNAFLGDENSTQVMVNSTADLARIVHHLAASFDDALGDPARAELFVQGVGDLTQRMAKVDYNILSEQMKSMFAVLVTALNHYKERGSIPIEIGV